LESPFIIVQFGPIHKHPSIPYTFILLPLMEAIGALFNFAQKQDIFINNFVAIIKVC
jgi:hypothetical protein